MPSDSEALLALLRQLYAAPGTIEGWRLFLESLRAAVGGSAANLMSHNLADHSSSFAANAGSPPEGLQLYEQYWCAHDPWAAASQPTRPGSVLPGDALVPHTQVVRSAFYADFGRRFDCVRVLAATLEKDPASSSVVSVLGSEKRRPFDSTEAALLEALVPHLQQALQLHRRLVGLAETASTFAQVVNRARHGQVLVDRVGRVVYVNAAARAVLDASDGLTIDAGELRANDPAATRRLRELLAAAITLATGPATTGGLMAVRRPSGRRAYSVLVCPVSALPEPGCPVSGPAVLVSIVDPDAGHPIDEHLLRSLLGLTPAEATLAKLLAEGLSPLEAAARLDVSRETVRSRLKVVLQKTGTHRQAELVRLVLNVSRHC